METDIFCNFCDQIKDGAGAKTVMVDNTVYIVCVDCREKILNYKDDLDDEEYCENDIRMTQDTYGKIKEDMDKMVKEMQKEMERKNAIEEIERKEVEIRELKDRIERLEKYKKYEEVADEVKAVHDAFLNAGFNETAALELVKLMF